MEPVLATACNFDEWRVRARTLLARGVPPQDVLWSDGASGQSSLFGSLEDSEPDIKRSIPKAFLNVAESVARHSNPGRWGLLYRVLWRIIHGERTLMQMLVDADMRMLLQLQKEVHHEAYRMRQFVRFREVTVHQGEPHYIAWYNPEHDVTESNAKFFVDRFGGMRWAILTPTVSLRWDLEKLHVEPGVPRSAAPDADELEDLWRAYYGSIYNPARLNIPAMRAQLPVRRWADLPECRVLTKLVLESRERVDAMAAAQPRSAALFVPSGSDLPTLADAVTRCSACALCASASGPVFGSGPAAAKVMLVGEQPGDQEDVARRVFVGPAGEVLNEALESVGLDRSQLYLTNAVKAFKHEVRGKFRIHQTPRASDISMCRPWLDAEIEAIRPDTIVCLGASAALAVVGRVVRIEQERGRWIPHATGARVLVSYHPAAILRAPDQQRSRELFECLRADLQLAAV